MPLFGLPTGLTPRPVLSTGGVGLGNLLQALGVSLAEGADAGQALREHLAPLKGEVPPLVAMALPEGVRGEFATWLRGEAEDLSPELIEGLLTVGASGVLSHVLSSKGGPSREGSGGVSAEPADLLPVMAEETAREILTHLGRANFFPDRGPPGPTSYQVSQFVRGYEAVREAMRRLGVTPEDLRNDPHLLYRGVTATDFDGTAINSTWNTAEVAWRGLAFFINRDLIPPLRRIAKVPEIDTDVTICTAWRVGLVDYLLGATHALGGGYPFMTYGWSRRPATMAYEDPAARAIFLGHGYLIEDAVGRAEGAYEKEGEGGWGTLTQEEQRERTIDTIEQDLLASPTFMTTEHLGQAAIGLLARLAAGPLEWEATPWTEDEIERLGFLLGRPAKDFFRPGGGFSVHRGGKTPSWARATGKTDLADSLASRGLADDASYHVGPMVGQGGRGILVEGGREFLPVRGEGDHAMTLLSTHYLDGAETRRITDAMEEPYDPGQGGKEIRIPRSPAKPATHPGGEGRLPTFRVEVATRVLRNPSAGTPVELDFYRQEYPVEAPLGQHVGVRWDVEDATVNGLRHGVVAADIPFADRARLAFWSGIEVGVARVVSNIVTRGRPTPFDGIEFALFAAMGFVGEALFGRTISGRATPMLLGGTVMMGAASGLSDAINPSQAVAFHPFGSLVFGAVYTGLQMVAQRSLVPAAVVSYARRVAAPLANKQSRRARNILWRGRLLAKGISLVTTTAISWLSRFFV